MYTKDDRSSTTNALYLAKFRPVILLRVWHTGSPSTIFLSSPTIFPPSQMQLFHYVRQARATSHFPPRRLSILDLRRCARARCHLPGLLFLLDYPLYLATRKSVAILSSSCTTWPHCNSVQWSRGHREPSRIWKSRVGVRAWGTFFAELVYAYIVQKTALC